MRAYLGKPVQASAASSQAPRCGSLRSPAPYDNPAFPGSRHRGRGFTLVELMVALAIGLLLAAGIGSLYLAVSRSGAFQDRLGWLHESGRFAVVRLEEDLQAYAASGCGSLRALPHIGSEAPAWSARSPMVHVAHLGLPDSAGMGSVDPDSGAARQAPATAPYRLGERFLLQGYRCRQGSDCTPALPDPAVFPPARLAPGARVPNSDVLTLRYLRGRGWSLAAADCRSGGTLVLVPQAGDPPARFAAGGMALVTDCRHADLMPVSMVASHTLTLGSLLPAAEPPLACAAPDGRERRAHDWSQDFVTVSWYLAFRVDEDPNARPNVGRQRLVPTLIRRENGVEQEVVRGVDRLAFTFGVADRQGQMRYLDAEGIDSRLGGTIACPPKAPGVAPAPDDTAVMEPGCLWRSVRHLEARLLVNSEHEIAGLDPTLMSYQFEGQTVAPDSGTPLPSGLPHGQMLRRPFSASVAVRGGGAP
jgi:type IV pilus assembly protein PilW